jgi:hypothetical protein
MSGSSNPTNNASGQYQPMLLGNSQWIDPKTGMPTPTFFALIRAVWIRTGSGAAPAGDGVVGLNFVNDSLANTALKAEKALATATMAILENQEFPHPSATTPVTGSGGSNSVDVVEPGDLGPPVYALAKAWFLGG